MAKPLHAASPTAGVLAALLAEEGVTAGDEVLEGERGWFDLVAGPGEWDEAAGLAALGDGFGLAIEGLGIKRFASCGVTHAPIEAALALRDGDVAAIERLELVVNPLARQIAAYDAPVDGLQSKFSLQHCIAVALSTAAPTSPSSPTRAPATRRSWRCETERSSPRIRRSAWPGT